ncbi:hypothetical protein SERLA73DRAFT_176839 [Serpula lacrymans var. lacrymans S7.3]|uniref:Uncharacterized protein n=1 Tax=Serpula lacrymans var. lacrymans (strain S7.3) TaxID=936435 RepID=F8PQ59_SERL3|nr:hypothetical protein SERLA73DRAFT_176839 [Serpula lacrymans var. lacrymans S7.3]
MGHASRTYRPTSRLGELLMHKRGGRKSAPFRVETQERDKTSIQEGIHKAASFNFQCEKPD